ncbi:MAG: YhbY family RNA-binding protein [Candidatus Bathyarchaeia archaeon]
MWLLWQTHEVPDEKQEREEMITPRMKRRIKHKLSSERPTIWIGKKGATQEVIDEIDNQLERTEIVKIRILRTALEEDNVEAIASRIAQQTKSTLFEVRGHTLIIYRKKE